jgi:hypothetical protein
MNGSKENKETRSFLFSSIEGVGFFFFLEKKKRNKASQIGMLEEKDRPTHTTTPHHTTHSDRNPKNKKQ